MFTADKAFPTLQQRSKNIQIVFEGNGNNGFSFSNSVGLDDSDYGEILHSFEEAENRKPMRQIGDFTFDDQQRQLCKTQ